MKRSLVFVLCLVAAAVPAQEPRPVIDMHLHSYDENSYYVAPDMHGRPSPATPDAHFDLTYQAMREHQVVLAVISNTVASNEAWLGNDVDSRFLRGFGWTDTGERSVETFRHLVQNGDVEVFGEIGAYYRGETLADPKYAPFLEICEEYGVPVALHTGGGPPGIVYRGAPNARLKYGDPLLIEDVLVKYPDLKIYLMHSGEFFYEEVLKLMHTYPQVYSDLGILLWGAAVPRHYGRQFLLLAKEFGMLDRVMFGSDAMVWPHAIGDALRTLDSFEFLTDEEKRDILYNNAARFLELSDEQIDAHHGR